MQVNSKTGTVAWFNNTKGFGFICPDDGSDEIFAHFSEIQVQGFRTLREGQRVSFHITQSALGRQAVQIQAEG